MSIRQVKRKINYIPVLPDNNVKKYTLDIRNVPLLVNFAKWNNNEN